MSLPEYSVTTPTSNLVVLYLEKHCHGVLYLRTGPVLSCVQGRVAVTMGPGLDSSRTIHLIDASFNCLMNGMALWNSGDSRESPCGRAALNLWEPKFNTSFWSASEYSNLTSQNPKRGVMCTMKYQCKF